MTAPASLTTTAAGQLAPPVDFFFNKQLLARQKGFQVHSLVCQQSVQPEGTGDQEKFRRVQNLTVATTPLTEGTPPAGQQVHASDILVQKFQYGDYITLSDRVTIITSNPDLNYNVDLLAQQMGETHDAIVRDVMATTASVYTCTNGTNGKSVGGNPMTEHGLLDVQKICRMLRSVSAKKFTPVISAKPGIGTSPVRSAYWALGHTDISIDLERITGFLQTARYPEQQGIMEAEWGQVSDARYLLSPLGKMTAGTGGAPDQYQVFYVARDAVGVSKINAGTVSHITHKAGDGFTGGPLDQWGTQGWKSYFGAEILNPAWIIRSNCTLAQ